MDNKNENIGPVPRKSDDDNTKIDVANNLEQNDLPNSQSTAAPALLNVNVNNSDSKTDNPFEVKKSNKKFIIIGAVVAIVILIAAVIGGLFYAYNTGNIPGVIKQGQSYGESNQLANIKVAVDGVDEPKVDIKSLEGVESIKSESTYFYHEGNGDVLKKGTNAEIQYIYYVYYNQDINILMNAKSQEDADKAKLDKAKWQEYQNTFKEGTGEMSLAVDPDDSVKPINSSDSESTNEESDALVNRLGKLVVGHHTGSVFSLFMPSEPGATAEDGTQSEDTPPGIIIAVISKANVPSDDASDDESSDSSDQESTDDDTPTISSELPDGAPTVDLSSGKPVFKPAPDFKVTDDDDVVQNVLEEGDGDEIQTSDTVTVKYSGWLLNGTEFDSSGDQTSSFALSGVIKGWTYGLEGLTVGSKVELIVPAKWAYGASANGKIPANSPLVFYVEITGKQ